MILEVELKVYKNIVIIQIVEKFNHGILLYTYLKGEKVIMYV